MSSVLSESLQRLCARYVDDPFADGLAHEPDHVPQQREVRQAVKLALLDGDSALAERLLLAMGVVQHLQGTTILGASVIDDDIHKKLPRNKQDYIRVAAAGARCLRKLDQLLGPSQAMHDVRRHLWRAAFGPSLHHALYLERIIRDDDVLILGETGTGKETVGQTLLTAAFVSPGGKPSPSSTINAAALPESLVESELFGHEKGSFTGATEARTGRIRAADGGCFFLDEVGDLPLATQVKLLRVLESDEVTPVGSDTTFQADVRFVAATHRDLERMVQDGTFRRDLFQRLAGNVIRLPPLRERPEDIVVIGDALVQKYLGAAAGPFTDVVDKARNWLRSTECLQHQWPGNVRELENTLRSVMLGIDKRVQLRQAFSSHTDEVPDDVLSGAASWQRASDWYLQRVLQACDSNYAQAAKVLGVDRSTVRRKARKLGI